MVDCRSDGPSHGDFPCLRIHSATNPRFSDHPARLVPGLPKNTYDPTWLASHSNFRVGCKDYGFMRENSLVMEQPLFSISFHCLVLWTLLYGSRVNTW